MRSKTPKRVAELEHEREDAALAALNEEPEGEERLANVSERINAETEKLVRLRAAIKAAERKAATSQLDADKRAHAKLAADAKRQCELRDKAAKELDIALFKAVNSFRSLCEVTDRLRHIASEAGVPAVEISFLAIGHVRQMLEAELWRQGAHAAKGKSYTFPGAKSPDVRVNYSPKSLPALTARIAKGNEIVTAAISGKAPDAPAKASVRSEATPKGKGPVEPPVSQEARANLTQQEGAPADVLPAEKRQGRPAHEIMAEMRAAHRPAPEIIDARKSKTPIVPAASEAAAATAENNG